MHLCSNEIALSSSLDIEAVTPALYNAIVSTIPTEGSEVDSNDVSKHTEAVLLSPTLEALIADCQYLWPSVLKAAVKSLLEALSSSPFLNALYAQLSASSSVSVG